MNWSIKKDILSDKEKLLIEQLGSGKLIGLITITELYRSEMEAAFIHNKQGKAIESLRRIGMAFLNQNPLRLTKEFDDLIELD